MVEGSENRMSTIKNIIKALGYDKSIALYYNDERLSDLPTPLPFFRVIKELNPIAFYCIDDKPFILFFELSGKVTTKDLFKKAWNAQVPIIIISFENHIEVYNGCSLNEKHELIQLESIEQEQLNESSAFSYWNLSDSAFWKKYEKKLTDPTLDVVMLDNIKYITNRLKTTTCAPFAVRLMLRLIFIRFLIDRGVDLNYKEFRGNNIESQKYLLKVMSSKSELYGLFLHLKNQFNGNLFELYQRSDSEYEQDLLDDLSLGALRDLMAGDLVLDSGQLSLFPLYDFNIIPVELISNIYERFLGDDKQKEDKAFYTPTYLVDYILDQTIRPYLKNNKACKVLDPACGSGIFLVETARRLIENTISHGLYAIDNNLLVHAITDNIFGIDKNPEAIDVAVFSIYLTILDYKDPKTLKNFKLPLLRGTNLYVCDFFSQETESCLENKSFDFIIGNPPWGSVGGPHVDYCEKNSLPIQNNEISRSFVLRTKDFSTKKTICCLIVTSKLFYNMKSPAVNFRKWLLTNAKISKYIELAAVRELIFKKARGPAGVVFYTFATDKSQNKENEICHLTLKPNIFFKLFNAIVIEKNDYKYIKQSLLLENDWAWKTIVFGNAHDYYIIRGLHNSYPTINNIIKSNYLISGTGIKPSDGNEDASHLKGRQIIDAKRGVSAFKVDTQFTSEFSKDKIDRTRKNKDGLFNPPYTLLKKGFDIKTYRFRAAYSEEEFIYPDAINGIVGKIEDKQTLLSLTGLINSSLYAYLNLMLGSSSGIEREQGFPTEILKYPAIINDDVAELVGEIQDILKKDCFFYNINESESLIQELDELILEQFDLKDDLFIDYALNVQIPLLAGEESVFMKVKQKQLRNYAEVFLNYFSNVLSNQYIRAQAYINIAHHFTAIEFIIQNEEPTERLNFIDGSQSAHLDLFSKFMLNKVNDLFYQMKDVIDFEENSFFVLKTDECKNWHPAMAKLDLADVLDSILSEGGVA
jgi:SAM-dependent methyltransferase